MRGRMCRMDVDGAAKQLDRFIMVTGLMSDHAQHVQRVELFGLPRQHRTVEALGIRQSLRRVVSERTLQQRAQRRRIAFSRNRRLCIGCANFVRRNPPMTFLVAPPAAAWARRGSRRRAWQFDDLDPRWTFAATVEMRASACATDQSSAVTTPASAPGVPTR